MNVDWMLKRHQEELNDAAEYMNMAEQCDRWHSVLCDIAHDEECHADMIKHMIDHQ